MPEEVTRRSEPKAPESDAASPKIVSDICERPRNAATPEHQPRVITAAEAIAEATAQAMEQDPRVFVMGEGATDPKGIFGTTAGLTERFGKQRVLEMPIAENGFTGMAIGAALMGQRPIVIHQRVEFCLLAVEQLFNNAAKMHYVSGGKHKVPMVVRLVVGRGWGQGPAHSQSLEGMFAQIPGLKLAMPSNAADAKGMLLAAVEDDNPVVLLEHRWMHYVSNHVDPAPTPAPLDGPRCVRRGRHVTVVATSYMNLEAMQAAEALQAQGCEVEVFDLRMLRPLQLDSIVESVKRTGHLVTVDTGLHEFGIGAEICSQVTSQAFSQLRQAPVRIGLPSHPTPSSRSLAASYYPRSPQIAAQIGALVGLSQERIDEAQAWLQGQREDLPLDIPHPSFKGPF